MFRLLRLFNAACVCVCAQVSGDISLLPWNADHTGWHESRSTKRFCDADESAKIRSSAGHVRARHGARKEDQGDQLHRVLGQDGREPQVRVRRGRAIGAHTAKEVEKSRRLLFALIDAKQRTETKQKYWGTTVNIRNENR